jgi:hypothetical protein
MTLEELGLLEVGDLLRDSTGGWAVVHALSDTQIQLLQLKPDCGTVTHDWDDIPYPDGWKDVRRVA